MVPTLILSDAKSLCRLALPDNEFVGRPMFCPNAGVPGIEEEGVRSPLSTPPPLLSLNMELRISSTSPVLRGVDGPPVYIVNNMSGIS